MTSHPQRHYTLDDYFMVEATSTIRHEYCDGQIFAMAGASVAHNDIAANVLSALRLGLRGSGCRAFGNDLRIATANDLFTYPDVSVVCGEPVLVPDRPDTVTNPVLLVEVLSDATRDYDRGEKLAAYQGITTLREVLLVDQHSVSVERWYRGTEGSWSFEDWRSLDAEVLIRAAPARLAIAEIYREVFAAPTS